MILILVEIQGDKGLQASFVKLSDLFSDLRPIFEKLGETFFPLVQKRFDQGGPGWPSLSPLTEARKARLYGGASRILVATKELYNSFTIGAPGSIERIKAQEAEFGSSVFYGYFHQEGKGVPQRKIIDVSAAEEAELAEQASDEVANRIRALGFEVA